jgi:branched-chain amino acid transport system ATP-binding protein
MADIILEAAGLLKSFGGVRALSGVDLSVERGSIVGVIGPNGAGKTTLFNLLSGFHRPDAGSVRIDGRDVTGRSPHVICGAGLARTFQIVRPFLGLSALDNVIAGAYARTQAPGEAFRIASATLEFVGLSASAHVPARELTLARQKRLEVGRALATQPKLLLLDEVFAGLTAAELTSAIQLVRDIAARGVTLLLIEHVMQVIMSLSQRIVVLHHGIELASGPPSEVVRNPAVIEAYLGEDYVLC